MAVYICFVLIGAAIVVTLLAIQDTGEVFASIGSAVVLCSLVCIIVLCTFYLLGGGGTHTYSGTIQAKQIGSTVFAETREVFVEIESNKYFPTYIKYAILSTDGDRIEIR